MNREQSIDSLKGGLILLVILGHLIGTLGVSRGGVWNFIYTFHMPLFVLISGYYLRTGKINIKMRNNIVSIIFVGIVCLACILGYYPDNANVLLKGADPYTLSDLPAKILLLICTLICVCSLWVLKCEVHFLAKIGENSLLYYLYHGLIIEFLMAPIIKHFGLPTNIIAVSVYFLLIIYMIHLMSRLSIFKWFVNPRLITTK